MNDSVCGIVVTYHPDEQLEEYIAVLRPQIGALVLVDNKSSDFEVRALRELAAKHDLVLLENDDNLGIGAALNRGIRWAIDHGGFRYVALFDQDSEASGNFVSSLVSCFESHPADSKTAVVACRILNRDTGAEDGPTFVADRYLVAQTSGSLMPLDVFDAVGWFREELFIDYVDYEFCLRAVTAGWTIQRCGDAVLSHSPGNSQRHFPLGRYLGTSMNYTALRHYYTTRNGIWVMLRHWRRHGRWCLRNAWVMLKNILKTLAFEKHRRAKLRMSSRGLIDGLRGNLGKRNSCETEN